jgi:tetratricopeptide (TPR) repeat protein
MPAGALPADVFISWTRADTDDGPARLAAALEAAGLSVWIDNEQVRPFDPIPDRVREGLSRAKVLVAWYSAAYPTRRACREELTLTLLAAENAGQGPQRVLVVNPEPDLGHVVEARLLDRRFAGADELADLSALTRRIADRVAELDGPFGTLPAPEPTRWYGGAGWQGGSARFVGRLAQLWQIHDRLHRTTGLVGPGRAGRSVAVVSGFGGVGKSLLAAEYAHLFASEYPGGVVWVSALGHDTTGKALPAVEAKAAADTQFAQIASWLGLDPGGHDPTTLRELVKTELDRGDRPVLWIVDDLPTGLSAQELDAWRCPAAIVSELVTTRDRSHGRLDAVDLDVLDPLDALAVLTQSRSLSRHEQEQAELLAEELGYHPLGCDIAGLYIAGSTTFAGYRAQVAGNLARFDELADQLADQLPGDHARQISTTLATSLTAVGEDAWRLLRLASQLAPVAIPRDLLVDVFTQLISHENDTSDANALSAELAVGRALNDRHQDGLWRYEPVSRSVTVHVLVRAAASALDPQLDAVTETAAAAVAAVTTLLAGSAADARRHPTVALSAQHARHLISGGHEPDEPGADLLGWLARLDFEAGRFAAAADHWGRQVDWRQDFLGSDHPGTLTSRNYLALAQQAAGRLAVALPLLEATLSDRARILGPEHPDTLASRGDLALAYEAAGRLADALPLLEATLSDRERILGPDHPHTVTNRGTLATAYKAAGRLADALPLLEATLSDRERILGPDHPDTLTSQGNLATAYKAAGRLADAVPLLEATLSDRERILGPDHPDTLTSRNNLATAYEDDGRLADALPLLKATLADRDRLLGPDHPDTMTSRNNLALAYQHDGRTADALPLLERTLADRERLFAPDHPDTLNSRNSLAVAYRTAGRLREALPLYERTLADRERILGPDHPDTMTSRNNLAVAYQYDGRLTDALPLYERTLADRERILGPDHPDTCGSRQGLAQARQESGRRRWWTRSDRGR